MPKKSYYAVANGRNVGVCDSWAECKANVDGYSGARYHKFDTVGECQQFIAQNSSGSGSSYGSSSYGGGGSGYGGSSSSYGGGSSYSGSYGSGGGSGGYTKPNASRYQEYEDGYRNVSTDGSCPGNGQNPNAAGRGGFFGKDHPWNFSERADGPPTNNRGEIQAATRAIQIAKQHGETKLRINTDSDFLIKGAQQYVPKWQQNGWRTADGQPVKNRDDFQRLAAEMDGTIDVKFRHVPGHSGDYGNEQADRLAREGAAK
ncbi:Ribonuclease H1 [Sergentomyia squamirostris]